MSESIQYVRIGAGRVVIAPAQLPVHTAARTVLLPAERRVNKSNNPPPLHPLPPGGAPHNDIVKMPTTQSRNGLKARVRCASSRIVKIGEEYGLGMFIALLSLRK